jgi:dipeptidyl aminopeptidase/acylaminoacyl peptidase
MPKEIYMTHEQREIHRKKRVLEHAERIGNVNKTCRYFGVARSTFYLWRPRYRELGDEGLKSRRCGVHKLFLIAGFLSASMVVGQVPPTPNDNDLPKPVRIEIDLAGSEHPDFSRFSNVRVAFSPSLSGDGSQLSFRTSITGEPQLWVVESQGGWPHQLTFGESVTFNEWSPSGDWIAYGTDRDGNEREGFYLVLADGSQERQLLPPSDAFRKFGGFSRDGGRIAYATTERNGRDFDIHVYDLNSEQDRLVYEGHSGVFVAAWRPDGKALLLTETRGEDANNVYLLDLETGDAQVLLQPEVAASYKSFAWKPDSTGFYVNTNQDREFSALAHYDVATGDLEFLETPQHDVSDVALSHDGRFLSWMTNEGGYSQLHLRDLVMGEEMTVPALPPGVYSLTWANHAPVASILIRGPRLPGDIWTWDLTSETLHRATQSSMAGLDSARFVVPTHHDFLARDGETLHGLLYLPSDLSPGVKPPLLLIVHGGPTAQARPIFSSVKQYFLSRGFAVFDLNFRGSTGYGKRFARLDNQRLRPNAVLDMEDAMAWLAKEGRVDTSRAAVLGGSYGGYMAFAAAVQFPELFKAAISIVGVSNWVTALEGASPELKAGDRIEYGDIDDPEDREFLVEISPITHVDQIKAPIMVLHGANDPRDPVTESDQFVRRVRENGGTVEYLRFPDEGHGIRKRSNILIMFRSIAGFLEDHLAVAE